MKRKALSESDRDIWQKVTSGVTPLHEQARSTSAEPALRGPKSKAAPATKLASAPRWLHPPSNKGSVTVETYRDDPQEVGRPEPGLDRRTAEKLRRGQRDPDARIDLHGMTSARAHLALDRFLASSISRNLRCVLVITGKGGRHSHDDAPFMRSDQGILRQAVPRWLRSGPFASRIVGVFTAHPRHGGEGAIYIYLKRLR